MKAKVISSVLIVAILVAGYILSCEYADTDWGLGSLVIYAMSGCALAAYVIIKWLWKD